MTNASTIAYLGLGSNLDDPEAQLQLALLAIGKLPGTQLLRMSRTYVSKPWGKLDQPDYLNMVAEIRTGLTPHRLLRGCKDIEHEQGRIETERWGPRQVDVDIRLFGGRTIRTTSLVVPHPRMWERAFVLRPLAELRPDLKSPTGPLITELLRRPEIASQGIWPYEPARKIAIYEE
jgi:2-amino-4-hydroxy-6-hydroxymethyldihydropteridine diphosphokinase